MATRKTEPATVEVTNDLITGKPIEATVTRSYKINAGNYESQDSFAAVKYTVSEDTDMIALGERAQADLDALQSPDLFRIQDVVNNNGSKSMINQLVN